MISGTKFDPYFSPRKPPEPVMVGVPGIQAPLKGSSLASFSPASPESVGSRSYDRRNQNEKRHTGEHLQDKMTLIGAALTTINSTHTYE